MIESPQNTHFKQLKQLTTQKKWRDRLGLFTIETPKVILEICEKQHLQIDTFFHTPDTPPPSSFSGNAVELSSALLSKVSHLASPSGWIVTIKTPSPTPLNALEKLPSGVLLDGVSDPSNVGAILRNVAAFDIGFVGLTPGTADLFHPEAIRASAGHIPPYFYCDEASFSQLSDTFSPVACCPHASLELDPVALPKNPLFILGSEGQGIRSPYLNSTINPRLKMVKLAMSSNVESLNVSVVSGILFYALQVNRKSL